MARRGEREPALLWVVAGPALTACAMALLSSGGTTRTRWSVGLLVVALALTCVGLQRWWAGR